MDSQIGIVCATCDGFNAFGATACVLCSTPLDEVILDGLTSGSAPPPTLAEPPLTPEGLAGALPDAPGPLSGAAAAASGPHGAPPPSSGSPASSDRTLAQPSPAHAPSPRIDAGSAALFSEALRLRRSTPGKVIPPMLDRLMSSPLVSPTISTSAAAPSPAQHAGGPPIIPVPVPASTASSASMPSPSSPLPSNRAAVSIPRPDAGGRPVTATRAPQPAPPSADPAGSAASLEELMEQAKNFICRSCSTPVPVGHKFCGRCGAAVPPDVLAARTQFFGQLQAPGKAKLILIRGEGVEGLSYQLNAEQHIVGRNGQLVFPDDPFVSPKHANLFYRNQKLVVRDEGSLNGVFLRVRGTVDVLAGDHFLAGEQLFRLDATPKFNDGPAQDGTYFYSSPKHQTPFRVAQILQGGAPGMVVCARTNGIQIGREGGDMNFPGDLYMSASHCKIDEAGGKLSLTDLNSRNGTYVRLKGERELAHGDYLFIGKKLLRVEITAA